MSEKTEQEILNHEAELLRAKQTLDIEALRRIYSDDLMLTEVLGEPTCSKSAIIEEVRRGITERESASASGKSFQMSAENEDVKVAMVWDCRCELPVCREGQGREPRHTPQVPDDERMGPAAGWLDIWSRPSTVLSSPFSPKQLASLGG